MAAPADETTGDEDAEPVAPTPTVVERPTGSRCTLCGEPIEPGQPTVTQFGKRIHRACFSSEPETMWGI